MLLVRFIWFLYFIYFNCYWFYIYLVLQLNISYHMLNATINEHIFNTYKQQILLKEFASTHINNLRYGGLHNGANIKNLYLMWGCNKGEDNTDISNIDTLYEIYVSEHSKARSTQRTNNTDTCLKHIDRCLECLPIEFLQIPNGSIRQIIFDVFQPQSQNQQIQLYEIPCTVTSSAPTKLTRKLAAKFKNVIVCDIVIKSIIPLDMPQFSVSDVNNHAIHIPISHDQTMIDLSNRSIKCNCRELNTLIMRANNNINPHADLATKKLKFKDLPKTDFLKYMTNDDRRVDIPYKFLNKQDNHFNTIHDPEKDITHKISAISTINDLQRSASEIQYPYVDFFDALEKLRIIRYPVHINYEYTLPKILNVQLLPNKNGEDIFTQAQNIGFDIYKSPIEYTPSDKNTPVYSGARIKEFKSTAPLHPSIKKSSTK